MGIEFVYGAGAAVLLAALIWGSLRYRSRKQGEPKVGDQATRAMYKEKDE